MSSKSPPLSAKVAYANRGVFDPIKITDRELTPCGLPLSIKSHSEHIRTCKDCQRKLVRKKANSGEEQEGQILLGI